jgi:hypothetical protein
MAQPITTEERILFLAIKQGPNALFCMPNRSICVLLVSLMHGILGRTVNLGSARLLCNDGPFLLKLNVPSNNPSPCDAGLWKVQSAGHGGHPRDEVPA